MADTSKRTILPYRDGADNPLDSIKGSNSTIFTGVDDLFKHTLDPIISGYAFIYWIKLPDWFDKDPDLKYYKSMSEKNFRQFAGIQDIELTTVQQQTGFANREFDVAAGVSVPTNEFTITHKEFSGGIMRKLYQKWISYIRDPRTGVALYPKLFGVDYGARNHTGELLYVTVRPDVTNTAKDIVEFAAYFTNVMPKNIPLSTLYNYEQGNQESPTIDIPFSGFMEVGPDVEEFARKTLREKILNVTDGGEGIPFDDSYGTNSDASSLATGTLGTIYNPTK